MEHKKEILQIQKDLKKIQDKLDTYFEYVERMCKEHQKVINELMK